MAFFSHTIANDTVVAADRPRSSFFSRIIAAMMLSRQRQAEREIERYLRMTGGKLTDAAEREIERTFLSPRY